MKAMEFAVERGNFVLRETKRDIPVPGEDEVLIQVVAAGVTPSEKLWYPTTHKADGSLREGAIPGHEFSGVVAAAGKAVKNFSAGDEVCGMNDWFAEGATAEYCLSKPEWLAAKPAAMSHLEAASVPIGALTAWEGLIERAKLQPGERVLVHGGAGAVGLFAIQMARAHGGSVATTAAADTLDFVRGLGVEMAIDYAKGDFEKAISKVDVVFDTVGGETLERSWGLLKPGGRMVTIAADAENSQDPRRKAAFFIVEANGHQLSRIAKLLETGELRTFLKAVVPLEKAADAYFGGVHGMRREGKLVISVA